jgi:hypothetical protein
MYIKNITDPKRIRQLKRRILFEKISKAFWGIFESKPGH